MPLTIAYANKPVTLIWGIIWGRLIFGEKITWNMLVGACVIFLGIYFVTTQEEPSEKVRKETEEHRKKAGQIQKEKEDRYHE